MPADELAYYLDTVHWLDAMTTPMERNLEKLVAAVQSLLPKTEAGQPVEEPAEEDVEVARDHSAARPDDEKITDENSHWKVDPSGPGENSAAKGRPGCYNSSRF